ncbi:MAG: P-II family nitrogen regulator, partial [Pyrinomonadaceae bacterium]|nr:P-II family nitrogen regulator [Pyrinomonadaceae bacterium]
MDRKLIIAIVQPFLVDKIVAALEEIENFPGITLAEAKGFGKKRKNSLDDPVNPFHPNTQMAIAAHDE